MWPKARTNDVSIKFSCPTASAQTPDYTGADEERNVHSAKASPGILFLDLTSAESDEGGNLASKGRSCFPGVLSPQQRFPGLLSPQQRSRGSQILQHSRPAFHSPSPSTRLGAASSKSNCRDARELKGSRASRAQGIPAASTSTTTTSTLPHLLKKEGLVEVDNSQPFARASNQMQGTNLLPHSTPILHAQTVNSGLRTSGGSLPTSGFLNAYINSARAGEQKLTPNKLSEAEVACVEDMYTTSPNLPKIIITRPKDSERRGRQHLDPWELSVADLDGPVRGGRNVKGHARARSLSDSTPGTVRSRRDQEGDLLKAACSQIEKDILYAKLAAASSIDRTGHYSVQCSINRMMPRSPSADYRNSSLEHPTHQCGISCPASSSALSSPRKSSLKIPGTSQNSSPRRVSFREQVQVRRYFKAKDKTSDNAALKNSAERDMPLP